VHPSRRAVLFATPIAAAGVAAGAVGAVETGLLPGKRRLTQAVEGCGADGVPPPDRPGVVARSTFASAARRREVAMVVAWPPGEGPSGAPGGTGGAGLTGGAGGTGGSLSTGRSLGLPVCLVLHGLGGNADQAITGMGLDHYLASATRSGVAPFALASVDGGGAYWHRRASGDDPEAMIVDEVRPRLARMGLATSRMAVLGWSMGGYGALLLARRHPSMVVAAAASSPAMWHSVGASAPGAFDSAADFASHRVLGTPPVPGVSYRIDCGDADEFSGVSRDAVRDLRVSEHSYGKGCHTAGYWRRVAPAQLAFVGRALTRPG
jgi:S-formylglutathione hydrolase FrmB